MTIVIDTETTGFLKASSAPVDQQPHIIEICCLEINDDTLDIVGELATLVKPPIPIPKVITTITTIDDNTVKDAPTFAEVYSELSELFFGQTILVAHNVGFDSMVLFWELMCINKQCNFPWPPIHHCTIEMSMHIKGYRLNLGKLHKIATGEDFEGAHRAKADTHACLRCYKYLMEHPHD